MLLCPWQVSYPALSVFLQIYSSPNPGAPGCLTAPLKEETDREEIPRGRAATPESI